MIPFKNTFAALCNKQGCNTSCGHHLLNSCGHHLLNVVLNRWYDIVLFPSLVSVARSFIMVNGVLEAFNVFLLSIPAIEYAHSETLPAILDGSCCNQSTWCVRFDLWSTDKTLLCQSFHHHTKYVFVARLVVMHVPCMCLALALAIVQQQVYRSIIANTCRRARCEDCACFIHSSTRRDTIQFQIAYHQSMQYCSPPKRAK